MVDVISCHEPCQPVTHTVGFTGRAASATATHLAARAGQGSGYPGGVFHLENDSHVAGNPAAHFDWPMCTGVFGVGHLKRVSRYDRLKTSPMNTPVEPSAAMTAR